MTEWVYDVVAGTKTVESVACLVKSVYVNSSPSSDITLTDGSNRVYIIPSGASVGNCYDFGGSDSGTRFEESLIVNAQDGDITVHYRILGHSRP